MVEAIGRTSTFDGMLVFRCQETLEVAILSTGSDRHFSSRLSVDPVLLLEEDSECVPAFITLIVFGFMYGLEDFLFGLVALPAA
jgi:hypothetical protein